MWDASGNLIVGQHIAIGARRTEVLNTSTLAGAAGVGGTITVSSTGRYGELAGKAVALEPSTGFSFDSPMLPRSR